MQHINDVTTPKIGRFYWVPTVLIPGYMVGGYGPGDRVPVLGPLHTDEVIDTPYEHYHYDLRFLRHLTLAAYGSVVALFTPDDVLIPLPAPELRRRKLRRLNPGFPPILCDRLEKAYGDRRMVDRICPHQGFNLTGIPADENGHITCPGHGMKWCVLSGLNVSRVGDPWENTHD